MNRNGCCQLSGAENGCWYRDFHRSKTNGRILEILSVPQITTIGAVPGVMEESASCDESMTGFCESRDGCFRVNQLQPPLSKRSGHIDGSILVTASE